MAFSENAKFLLNFVELSKLNNFTENLKERLTKPLPHIESHMKVAVSSKIRQKQARTYKVSSDAKESAVVIALFRDSGLLKFPLILRNTYEGVHSNQIGLPGGKLEPGETHSGAALREFEEELGHKIEPSHLLSPISSVFIPPSNFNLKPYISMSDKLPNFIPDEKEVAEIFLTSTQELVNATIQKREIPMRNSIQNVKCFILQGQIVWGATAAVLSEFRDILMEISP